MVDVRVKGADQLVALAAAAKAVDSQLRKDLLKGIRLAAKPVTEDLKESARENLPAEGGLNEFTASARFAVRTRATGKQAGVRIAATNKGHDIEATNKGAFRHPVYGNRKNWVLQRIAGGWWDKGAEKSEDRVRREVLEVMDGIAKRIDRAVE